MVDRCRCVVVRVPHRAGCGPWRPAVTPAGRWLTWATLTGVSFTALEADALRRGDLPSTLTWAMRGWLGLQPRRPRYLLRVTAFNLALLWTACHITSGRLGFDVRWRGADPCEYLED